MSTSRTIIAKSVATTMATSQSHSISRSLQMRLRVDTPRNPRTCRPQASCQTCTLASHSSRWSQGRRDVELSRRRPTRMKMRSLWASLASTHRKERRKSLLIASTTIKTSMRKVCAKIVTISRVARSLPLAAQARKCTLKSCATTATWSTMGRRRERWIRSPRLPRNSSWRLKFLQNRHGARRFLKRLHLRKSRQRDVRKNQLSINLAAETAY